MNVIFKRHCARTDADVGLTAAKGTIRHNTQMKPAVIVISYAHDSDNLQFCILL